MCLIINKLPVHREGFCVVQKVRKALYSDNSTPYSRTPVPKDGMLVATGTRDVRNNYYGYYSKGRQLIYGGYIHSSRTYAGMWSRDHIALAINVQAWGEHDVCSDMLYIPSLGTNKELDALCNELKHNKPVYINTDYLLHHLGKKSAKNKLLSPWVIE